MKKKYLIQNQKLKRIGLSFLSVVFLFSCNELNPSNSKSKFIGNLQKETSSKINFTIIDPETKEEIHQGAELKLEYTYFVKANVEGEEKFYTLKGEKNTSRKKRDIPLVFEGFVDTMTMIGSLLEAGKTNNNPKLTVGDKNKSEPIIIKGQYGRSIWEIQGVSFEGLKLFQELIKPIKPSGDSSPSKLPEEIENSFAQLQERLTNLKKKLTFNPIPFSNLKEKNYLHHLIKVSEGKEKESQEIREQREQLTEVSNQLNSFEQKMYSSNYESLLSDVPPEFNKITVDQLLIVNESDLEGVFFYELNKIHREALRIEIEAMQNEFFTRFIAYQAREAENLNRIETAKENKDNLDVIEKKLKPSLEKNLNHIITIQKMLLRGIALAKHAINIDGSAPMTIIRNGLMKVIKEIDKAIELENFFYKRIIRCPGICVTSEGYFIDYSIYNCFLRVVTQKQIFFNEPSYRITEIEQIHSLNVLNSIEELKFNSIEAIKAELSNFITNSTQGS